VGPDYQAATRSRVTYSLAASCRRGRRRGVRSAEPRSLVPAPWLELLTERRVTQIVQISPTSKWNYSTCWMSTLFHRGSHQSETDGGEVLVAGNQVVGPGHGDVTVAHGGGPV
jgi:hypothetical protein